MIVYNHLLFSEIFFQQIRQETTDLDNLRATLSTIRATWQYYLPPPPGWDGPTWVPSGPFPPDDVAQLRANVVEQIFAYLELTYGPCEGDGSTAPALSGVEGPVLSETEGLTTSDRAFFLYADWSQQDRTGLCEARDLLPLDVSAYRAVCLRDLLAEMQENHKRGLHYDDGYAILDRLQALFALIDQGDPTAGVPAYNGGLFDPGRRPFLTRHRVRNEYLQAALIRLATIPARGQTCDQDREPQPIDYRDLSVRHLGSLYEGLLEYNLFVVKDEPRVVRVSKKKTQSQRWRSSSAHCHLEIR
jgi:hypothetical protein